MRQLDTCCQHRRLSEEIILTPRRIFRQPSYRMRAARYLYTERYRPSLQWQEPFGKRWQTLHRQCLRRRTSSLWCQRTYAFHHPSWRTVLPSDGQLWEKRAICRRHGLYRRNGLLQKQMVFILWLCGFQSRRSRLWPKTSCGGRPVAISDKITNGQLQKNTNPAFVLIHWKE